MNHHVLLGQYDFSRWDGFLKFKDRLLDKAKQEFSAMMEEGKLVARTALQASLDEADAMA